MYVECCVHICVSFVSMLCLVYLMYARCLCIGVYVCMYVCMHVCMCRMFFLQIDEANAVFDKRQQYVFIHTYIHSYMHTNAHASFCPSIHPCNFAPVGFIVSIIV